MIITMLFTVEGSQPEISRCVNVEPHIDLSRLAQIIDASLGFSGVAGHLFIHQEGEHSADNEVYAENPGAGERSMTSMTVGEMPPMLYVYDPAANWNVHVRRLGESQLEGPTPLLIHAQGPDVVETANGPEMMTRFHEEARNLAAGLPPNMEVTPLLLSYLPVMTPERMLDRLSVVDPVAVATRMGFVSEELGTNLGGLPGGPFDGDSFDPGSFDDAFEQGFAAGFGDEPEATPMRELIHKFLDDRPDLQEILETDPNAQDNPVLVEAFSEFFDRTIAEMGGVDAAMEAFGVERAEVPGPRSADMHAPKGFSPVLAQYLEVLGPEAPLTVRGNLKVAVVRELVRMLGLPVYPTQPREDTWEAVHLGRLLLEELGLVAQEGSNLVRTAAGERFLNNPSLAGHEAMIHAVFADYFSPFVWRQTVEVLRSTDSSGASPMAEHTLDTLMVLGGIYAMGDVNVITEELLAVIDPGAR